MEIAALAIFISLLLFLLKLNEEVVEKAKETALTKSGDEAQDFA